MASVNSETERTMARQQLDFALGQKRVKLSDLAPTEFDELLRTTLSDINLRELRGFKPLEQFLTFHTGTGPTSSLEMNNLEIDAGASIITDGLEAVDRQTHVLSVSRGVQRYNATYRRFESGEETDDFAVACEWGRTCCLQHGDIERLVMRRPNDHTHGEENFCLLSYSFLKVPNRDLHRINVIRLEWLPVGKFRQHFGAKSAEVATSFIWELHDAHERTLSELKSRVESFDKAIEKLERLAGAIGE